MGGFMDDFMDFNKKFFDPLGLVFKPEQKEETATQPFKSGITVTGTDKAPSAAALARRRNDLPGGSFGSALRVR